MAARLAPPALMPAPTPKASILVFSALTALAEKMPFSTSRNRV